MTAKALVRWVDGTSLKLRWSHLPPSMVYLAAGRRSAFQREFPGR